jgi:hypothetical protein
MLPDTHSYCDVLGGTDTGLEYVSVRPAVWSGISGTFTSPIVKPQALQSRGYQFVSKVVASPTLSTSTSMNSYLQTVPDSLRGASLHLFPR